MHHTLLITALSLLPSFPMVCAHGFVRSIVTEDGTSNQGWDPSLQFKKPVPEVAGWTADNLDNGFVDKLDSPDIVCHKNATPGKAYVTVPAGSNMTLQWNTWPQSHVGPVIDYLAPCPNNDCTNVDKTQLSFVKIDEAGLKDPSKPPGKWASDDMIQNNNSWVVMVPSVLQPGKYVLRHEMIALHQAQSEGGAQYYPQCVNLEVTGTGTTPLPEGVPAMKLYQKADPGIKVNVYNGLKQYTIPGPPIWNEAGK